jgi:hypothetical protein
MVMELRLPAGQLQELRILSAQFTHQLPVQPPELWLILLFSVEAILQINTSWEITDQVLRNSGLVNPLHLPQESEVMSLPLYYLRNLHLL